MLDLSRQELQFAVDAARAAAQLAQRVYTAMEVRGIEKRDLSPVTVADYAGQAVIAKGLFEAFPDAVLVAEEDAHDLKAEPGQETLGIVTDIVKTIESDATPQRICEWIDRGNGEPSDRFWTLDPIDGTKGYLRGEQYAIALARVENGQVTLGVLACPNLGEGCALDGRGGVLVAAVRGQGAWCAPLNGDGPLTDIHVSACSDMAQARMLRSVESGHTNVGQIGRLTDTLGLETDPVSLDSQAKYAVLGSGGGELLFRLLSAAEPDYRERVWDQAAGSIVVEEAGGRITDLQGKVLDFTRGRTLAGNRGICASNGLLHEQALEALSKLS